ncbi:MAG: Rieske (2Fe-2S) protein [Rhodospirillales bacterium]|jgi:nitrite reductase/ring-hydroxylating ferredoxin subunit|nr:Rieske (2Fe-2S) protein [Rhodospirillales bacterium]MDP6644498.1 Rieske (2Fe-2S) protein [Rhodospirillales bacterium]MDP6840225.1 Rieske (2Fe-2S) protein [Rhodospirillales bacterium]|tara:strand:- start:536 stop:895 length:360 start_codon:yes stop_codon:yes gene_type:complete
MAKVDEHLICALADIDDGAAKGFDVEVLGKRRLLFGVRRGEAVHVYINSCPHTGAPLNIRPDKFLTSDGKLINCSTHGALFNIEDGMCIAGPCQGRPLHCIPAHLRGSDVFIETRPFKF